MDEQTQLIEQVAVTPAVKRDELDSRNNVVGVIAVLGRVGAHEKQAGRPTGNLKDKLSVLIDVEQEDFAIQTATAGTILPKLQKSIRKT